MNHGNRLVSRRQLSRTIAAGMLADPSSRHAWMRRLAAYVVTHRLQHQTDLILNDIARELMTQGNTLNAEVAAARHLSAEARQSLVAFIKTQTGAHDIQLHQTVQQDLVGGFIVRTPDTELDASVQRSLRKLAAIA